MTDPVFQEGAKFLGEGHSTQVVTTQHRAHLLGAATDRHHRTKGGLIIIMAFLEMEDILCPEGKCLFYNHTPPKNILAYISLRKSLPLAW